MPTATRGGRCGCRELRPGLAHGTGGGLTGRRRSVHPLRRATRTLKLAGGLAFAGIWIAKGIGCVALIATPLGDRALSPVSSAPRR